MQEYNKLAFDFQLRRVAIFSYIPCGLIFFRNKLQLRPKTVDIKK